MALALSWSARVMGVALEMVVPGIAGSWLDRRLGTGFLVIVGFVFGLVVGVWHLLAMVGAIGKRNRGGSTSDRQTSETDKTNT
jgi:hypothetical protein